MSFERASAGAVTESESALDFSRRANLSELMDEPCSYEVLRECLRDLEQVNRLSFGYRPTLRWLEQSVLEPGRQDGGLHIVDVGCGGGDTLRRIERWAAGEHLAVRLTGVDRNPNVIRAAREFTPAKSRIEWITGEAFCLSASDSIDVIISSLFTHHLADDEIVRFTEWMERVALRGWFINDLYRSHMPYLWFKVLATVMRWHPFVRHDGPVSFQRAFLPDEWKIYAEQSGLDSQEISIKTVRPARLCVGRVKPT